MGRIAITTPARIISEVGYEDPSGSCLSSDNSRFRGDESTHGIRQVSSVFVAPRSWSLRRGAALLRINSPSTVCTRRRG